MKFPGEVTRKSLRVLPAREAPQRLCFGKRHARSSPKQRPPAWPAGGSGPRPQCCTHLFVESLLAADHRSGSRGPQFPSLRITAPGPRASGFRDEACHRPLLAFAFRGSRPRSWLQGCAYFPFPRVQVTLYQRFQEGRF
ncbi:hypothetical protein NN561_002779 [Cricetulus griseus]